MLSSAEILATSPTGLELQVELVRMCIAEAGYDPALIEPYDGPRPGFTFVSVDNAIPSDVCWRARELVGAGDPKCLRCTIRDQWDGVIRPCGATARLELDCGALGSGNDWNEQVWSGDQDRDTPMTVEMNDAGRDMAG